MVVGTDSCLCSLVFAWQVVLRGIVTAPSDADETSWKTLAKLRWVWIGSSNDSVFFEIKASRSARAFQEVFGAFKGGESDDCGRDAKKASKKLFRLFHYLFQGVYTGRSFATCIC